MQLSSINLFAIGLSLLGFVDPFYSEPDRFYWASYEPYNPANVRSQSLFEHIQNPQVIPSEAETNYEVNPNPLALEREAEIPDYYEYFPPSNEKKTGYGTKEETLRSGLSEQEVIEKMKILEKFLSEDSSEKDFEMNKIIPEESRRVVRAVQKEKPGFFWTLARVTFEMINDTTSAIKQISNIINDTIMPDSATQSSMMSAQLISTSSTNTMENTTTINGTETASTSPSTTTPEPYVLTRGGLQNLIRRNVLGLVRLFNIEWKDALNQSEVNVKEFQHNLGNQVGMYLRDNPNAY